MVKAFGKYFDGVSSKPQEIELQLDEINAELRFGISSESNNWAIDDISFVLIRKTLEIRNREHSLALIKVEDAEFTKCIYFVFKSRRKD